VQRIPRVEQLLASMPGNENGRTSSTRSSTLITWITQALMSLGLNWLHDLTSPNGSLIITVAQLKVKFFEVIAKRNIALRVCWVNRLAALVYLPQVEELYPNEIHNLLAYQSTGAGTFAIYCKFTYTHQRTN